MQSDPCRFKKAVRLAAEQGSPLGTEMLASDSKRVTTRIRFVASTLYYLSGGTPGTAFSVGLLQLADSLGVHYSTASRDLHRLEAAGVISRITHGNKLSKQVSEFTWTGFSPTPESGRATTRTDPVPETPPVKKPKPRPKNGRLMRVRIESLNRTFAQGVREHKDENAVVDYVAAGEKGVELPPVTVFACGGSMFLADGDHRVEAAVRRKQTAIKARVFEHDTADEARSKARTFAAGANAEHGVKRSDEDKRRAVRSVINEPEFKHTTNRQLAEVCKVGHMMVNQIRRELTANGTLTGPAAAGTEKRPVKIIRNFRTGFSMLLDGRVVPNAELDRVLREAGRADLIPADEGDRLDPTPNEQKGRATFYRADPFGRQIPGKLAPIFAGGKKFLHSYGVAFNTAYEAVNEALVEPWGGFLVGARPEIEATLRELIDRSRKGIPWAVCVCNDSPQPDGPACRVCGGRRWVSRNDYDSLDEAAKALFGKPRK